jgi:VanZ family protein
MRPGHDLVSSRSRQLRSLSLIYAGLMLYSSTVIGPNGPHFVYHSAAEAFRMFRATPYVMNGSDQRADWMGNLLMLVPFGFLVTGTLWSRRPVLRLPAAAGAMLICLSTILAIKYLQLFFPPRTVTLNYILAQSAGAMLGCAGFVVWQLRVWPSANRHDPVAMLMLALRLYFAALAVFLLMPLDFALNAADLAGQIERLPDTVFALPGADHSLGLRVPLLMVAAAAFVPVGVMLTFVRAGGRHVRRSILSVTAIGLALTTGVFLLSMLVLSASPAMASILYRTGGIVGGAAIIGWLSRQDPGRLREALRRSIPWLILPYLATLLLVNRLLSTHWLSLHDAIAQAYPLGVLPLFDYYIVSKAAAAKNIVGHGLMYLPIGVAVWLRDATHPGGRPFLLAAAISACVELARYLRPGLEGDINAILVAGLSAMFAARLMPAAWSMLAALSEQPAPAAVRHPVATAYRRSSQPVSSRR